MALVMQEAAAASGEGRQPKEDRATYKHNAFRGDVRVSAGVTTGACTHTSHTRTVSSDQAWG